MVWSPHSLLIVAIKTFFFSLNLQEKKWLYVRDKIINHNLEIILCIKSPHVGWFCSMVGFITHKYKTGVFNFNKTHVWSRFLLGWKHPQKICFWTHLDTENGVKIRFYLIMIIIPPYQWPTPYLIGEGKKKGKKGVGGKCPPPKNNCGLPPNFVDRNCFFR